MQAVQTLNGVELGGRKILVREDREDRDVKQYNRDNGLEGEVGLRWRCRSAACDPDDPA